MFLQHFDGRAMIYEIAKSIIDICQNFAKKRSAEDEQVTKGELLFSRDFAEPHVLLFMLTLRCSAKKDMWERVQKASHLQQNFKRISKLVFNEVLTIITLQAKI